MTVLTDLLNQARSEIGYTENPYGSNLQKFAGAAGHLNGYAWCASFAVAIARRVGIKMGNESAYTPSLYNSLKAMGLAISGPRVGCAVFFYYPSQGRIAHVGFVESIRPDGYFYTIEGNTDEVGGRTGGKVMRKVRSSNNCFFALLPNPGVTPAPAPKPGALAPAFPLPRGYYFGPKTGPAESVSGYYSHREDLRRWQQRMISRGWDMTADGLYGDETEEIARDFQHEKRLLTDGLIGPATWAAAWTAPVS